MLRTRPRRASPCPVLTSRVSTCRGYYASTERAKPGLPGTLIVFRSAVTLQANRAHLERAPETTPDIKNVHSLGKDRRKGTRTGSLTLLNPGASLPGIPICSRSGGEVEQIGGTHGSVSGLLLNPCAAAHVSTPATRALARHVAIPAKHRAIASRFEGYSSRLSTARTDHRSALTRSRTIAGSPLIIFLCHAARFATFGCRITAFLEERLIGSGEGKFLSTIAALQLHISGHGTPFGSLYCPIY
jgi:hypothetical protein